MKKFANKVQAAKAFAVLAHDDQMYGEGLPYLYHLDRVYNVLLNFDIVDKDLLAAGYLHDVIEDREVNRMVIGELFGAKVELLVWSVTDEPGASRKERKAATYPKICDGGFGAMVVKLADRIANLEHSHAAKGARMWKMYKKEQPGFEAGLRRGSDVMGLAFDEAVTLQRMWNRIDALLGTEPQLPAPQPVKMEV